MQLSSYPSMRIPRQDEPFSHSEDEKIIQITQKIMLDSIEKNASDIHFEPYHHFFRVRIRVDGILHEMTTLTAEIFPRIIARLKIMSHLDIAEKRLPQDGRFTLMVKEKQYDCRINVCPTLFGEKIVVRILHTKDTQMLSVDALGFSGFQKNQFLTAIHKPQGLILVTGPTGSGKTISLYTALKEINQPEKNIATVEDPVEIELLGINQININPKIDLTFANVLRALLRQDPDVLMIGEIRDQETAEIAVKAAQTGHLVLSTLHANGAIEAVYRLVMMGIPMFHLMQSLQLIMAQRLARQLCHHCKIPAPNQSHQEKILTEWLKHSDSSSQNDFMEGTKPVFWQAQGCSRCMKGYLGRCGIFEFFSITSKQSDWFIEAHQPHDLVKRAKSEGMLDLSVAALKKIISGDISLEEAMRVVCVH